MAYTKSQMAAVVEHVGRQLEYRTAPSTKTAAALLAARRKVARVCGGKGDGEILDSVRILRQHLPADPARDRNPREQQRRRK